MRVSPNFILQEFVPIEIYREYGERALSFTRQEVIDAMQCIRWLLGVSVIINNKHRGGPFNYRGWRPITYKDGADHSQHRLANAIDFHVKDMEIEKAYEILVNNADFLFRLGVRRIEVIEATQTYIHIDFANTGLNEVEFFKP